MRGWEGKGQVCGFRLVATYFGNDESECCGYSDLGDDIDIPEDQQVDENRSIYDCGRPSRVMERETQQRCKRGMEVRRR